MLYVSCFLHYSILSHILLNNCKLLFLHIKWTWIHDKTTPLQLLTTNNNNLSFKHEKQVKNSRKHTLKQEEMKMCRNFQQDITWRRWTVEGEEESRKGKKFLKVLSPFLPSYWLFKEKKKIQNNILTFGKNYQLLPLVLPTIHISPKAF